jgi:thymidine kinase
MQEERGHIHLIVGPMFSGKSTHLIHQVRRYRSIGTEIMVIKPSMDTRYDAGDKLSSHDHTKEDCIGCRALSEVFQHPGWSRMYTYAKVIAIEEAQFFDDLDDFCKLAAERDGKHVIACGLSGDYRRNAFPAIARLLPLADRIEQLHSFCLFCKDGTPAPFTLRTSGHSGAVHVGGAADYVPVCRKHYAEKGKA